MAHLLDSQEKFEKDLAGNEDFAAQFAPGIEPGTPVCNLDYSNHSTSLNKDDS